MPAGRPTKYTKALGNRICTRLAGGESLRSICVDKRMPAISTVMLWVVDGKHTEFSEQYMIAREAAGFAHADRVADVASRCAEGDGSIDPSAARVAITGLTWAAERMAPKKHSPKQEIDHSSSDGSMTPPTRIEIVAPDDNSSN